LPWRSSSRLRLGKGASFVAAAVSCTSTQTTASRRKQEQIAAEAALGGIYVLRTSVPGAELEAPEVVRAYKQLKEVERAFRTFKARLELRAIHHRLEQRVRATSSSVAGKLRASCTVGLARGERMTLSLAYQNARSVPGSILLTRKLRKKKPK
jgi:hypothetical protein